MNKRLSYGLRDESRICNWDVWYINRARSLNLAIHYQNWQKNVVRKNSIYCSSRLHASFFFMCKQSCIHPPPLLICIVSCKIYLQLHYTKNNIWYWMTNSIFITITVTTLIVILRTISVWSHHLLVATSLLTISFY